MSCTNWKENHDELRQFKVRKSNYQPCERKRISDVLWLKLLVLLSSYFSRSDLSKRRILQHSNGERGYNLYFGSFCSFVIKRRQTVMPYC